MNGCRIVLVDDHSLFRNGLRGLLDRCEGCRVVAEAACGEEFLAMLPGLDAEVVFMDISMPGMNGDETAERALRLRPELKIITLWIKYRWCFFTEYFVLFVVYIIKKEIFFGRQCNRQFYLHKHILLLYCCPERDFI